MVGFGLIFTVVAAVLVQPLASVPVTVYVIVEDGLADTVDPVGAESPVEGLHIYEVAPPPVRDTDWPLHSTVDTGVAVTVGAGIIFTVPEAVLVHPFPSVPVTV